MEKVGSRCIRVVAVVLLIAAGLGAGPGSASLAHAPLATTTGPAAQGTMRIADFSDVVTFDPVLAQNTQSAYLYPVYDTLVRQNADQHLIPHLATAWTDVDQSTLRFTLRDDVVFHDGSRFDASVVKANLDRAKATEGNPNAPTFAPISEVVVIDAVTVEVRFAGPHPTFLIEMSLVQGMMVSSDAIAAGTDMTREPRGSGGWVWNRSESQDGVRQVFDRNADYWAPDLQGVERFEITVVADNDARFNALQTGQVDLVGAATPDMVAEATDLGLTVMSLDVDLHFILIIDRAGSLVAPLADPRVRQAIGHAIDREGYVDVLLDGRGTSAGGLVSPALVDWYDETLAGVPSSDPDLARELLAEAGYADGFDLTMPTLPLIQTETEAIAQMLGEVGIRVELAPLQGGQLGPEMRRGSFAAAFTFATQYHPYQTLSTFASGNGPFNPFGLDDTAGIDELLAEAGAADPVAAKPIYTDVQRDVIDAGIMIPIAFAPNVILTTSDVDGAFVPLGARNALPYGVRLVDA
jgi:peptide/nickel transport system substrate-binding protein